MTLTTRDYYRSTRYFRYRIKSVFSKKAKFHSRLIAEEQEWRQQGFHHQDISKDGWVIQATGAVYIAVSKSANTTMKHLITEEMPSSDYIRQIKNSFPDNLGSDDTLIHFISPSGMVRLRDMKLTPGDLAEGKRRCFTVVRHPISRFTSAWRDKVATSRSTPLKDKLREFLKCQRDYTLTIDDLVAYVVETPSEDMDKHVRPQWACCGAGRIPFEMVGKVERLKRDIDALCDAGLISAESASRLTVRNASVTHTGQSLTKQQKAVLSCAYARDFEVFDY